eukprot:TRINITY_DN9673_c0_g1_i2.p1 TRINITY_DN9673_c0_g1~~TRINITY_DN9673_c0_g1_i2.p1  ORF type:complete len:648 (+),score=166.56 TRINITY_DN9673_c0_g1_i2:87-1946(+)
MDPVERLSAISSSTRSRDRRRSDRSRSRRRRWPSRSRTRSRSPSQSRSRSRRRRSRKRTRSRRRDRSRSRTRTRDRRRERSHSRSRSRRSPPRRRSVTPPQRMRTPPNSMQILVILVSGDDRKTLTLEVDPQDTIACVKAKVKDQEGVPLDNPLRFDGRKLLDDGRTLRDYNIQKGSTLEVSVTIQIFVKHLTGHTLTVAVDPRDSVACVRAQIHEMTDIPPNLQRLISNGKQLEGGQDDYWHSVVADQGWRTERYAAWVPEQETAADEQPKPQSPPQAEQAEHAGGGMRSQVGAGSAPVACRVRCRLGNGAELISLRMPLVLSTTVSEALAEVQNRVDWLKSGHVVKELLTASGESLGPMDPLGVLIGEERELVAACTGEPNSVRWQWLHPVSGEWHSYDAANTAAIERAYHAQQETAPVRVGSAPFLICTAAGASRGQYGVDSRGERAQLVCKVRRQIRSGPLPPGIRVRLPMKEMGQWCEHNFHPKPGDSVRELKETVRGLAGLTAKSDITVYHDKRELDDNVVLLSAVPDGAALEIEIRSTQGGMSLARYGIRKESTLDLVLRLCGGMFTRESGKEEFEKFAGTEDVRGVDAAGGWGEYKIQSAAGQDGEWDDAD